MKRKNIVRLVENLTDLKYKSISDCLDRIVFTNKPYNRKNIKPLKSEWHFIYVEKLRVKNIVTLKKQLDILEMIFISKTVLNLKELEGRREFGRLLYLTKLFYDKSFKLFIMTIESFSVFTKEDFIIEKVKDNVIVLKIKGTIKEVTLKGEKANDFFFGNNYWVVTTHDNSLIRDLGKMLLHVAESKTEDDSTTLAEMPETETISNDLTELLEDIYREVGFEKTVESLVEDFGITYKKAYEATWAFREKQDFIHAVNRLKIKYNEE